MVHARDEMCKNRIARFLNSFNCNFRLCLIGTNFENGKLYRLWIYVWLNLKFSKPFFYWFGRPEGLQTLERLVFSLVYFIGMKNLLSLRILCVPSLRSLLFSEFDRFGIKNQTLSGSVIWAKWNQNFLSPSKCVSSP